MTILDRRTILKSAATLPLAAVLADPRLARAAASGLEMVTATLASGASVAAALATPAGPARGSLVLIHEWWGLNDQIKAVGAALAGEGYVALCADLYGGAVTASPDEAPKLMAAVDDAVATDTLAAWADWLGARHRGLKRGTIGWCFGGAWSLKASIAMPMDATVIYYGRVDQPMAALRKLTGPVLGHFATRDRWITEDMVATFEERLAAAGKDATIHRYEADHAFANPTSRHYDKPAAELAWRRTLDFCEKTL